jgi:hypothetical protein
MDIVTHQKCGLLGFPRTVPIQQDESSAHCAGSPLSRQPSQAIRRTVHTTKSSFKPKDGSYEIRMRFSSLINKFVSHIN